MLIEHYPLISFLGVLGMSLHNSDAAGKFAFVNLGIEVWWQKQYLPYWKLYRCVLKPAAKTPLLIFSLQNNFLHVWVFWKKQGCMQLLVGWHDNYVSFIQGNNKYDSQYLKAPSSSISVMECYWYPKSMFTQLWNRRENIFFFLTELEPHGKSSIFALWKLDKLQPQACQKNNLVHFSLNYNNKFGQVFEFSEEKSLNAILAGMSPDHKVSLN